MATQAKKRKLSWTTLLSAILAILPILLQALNEESESGQDTVLFAHFDGGNGKLRVSLSPPSGKASVRTRVENSGP